MKPGSVLMIVLLLGILDPPATRAAETGTSEHQKEQGVSFYRDVRPLFQASCHGCHQPAKAKGEFVMTDFKRLLAGGESKKPAVVPGQPEASHLVQLITPVKGEVEMPMKGDPLTAEQIALVRQWIAQGAKDDTPANARQRFDMAHPPSYTRPPVVTSLDFSPDGHWLAIAGFHEVFLYRADGSELVARLVGLSERIESVRFSPDGERLAVTGGLPARMGEVQVWDVAKRKLTLSVPVTFDTVYGASWSPDGQYIAFGCADNTVRAIKAKGGSQVLFQRAPEDWVLDTVFSVKGDYLVAVGRDMTAKLIEFKTQRFVDNITSITPGALKGGLLSVDRHPERDEILVGGSDGVPQIYRMHRQTKRVIGDNANLIRRFPPLKGRIFSVAYRPDGKRIAAGSSLDGAGALQVYRSDFDSRLTKELKAIFSKRVASRNAAERKKIAEYQTRDVQLLAALELPTPVYAVAYSADGKRLAAAGADGAVRLFEAESLALLKAFVPAPLPEELRGKVVALSVEPRAIRLGRKFDYAQLLVTGWTAGGEPVDVTRRVAFECSVDVVQVATNGLVRPKRDGATDLSIQLGGQTARVPVQVSGVGKPVQPDFIQDVMPVVARLGCNAGTCHGAKEGKNGFKLSLRGYDPVFDVRAFVDDLAGRRVNVASPDDSLMLLKATAAVPHEGGQRTTVGSDYYQIIRDWIADGCPLNRESPRVKRIAVFPENPVVQQIGAQQQVRVVATYTDSRQRDVTAEAFITSGDTEIAKASESGLLTTLRRGEAPVLARFEGAYAATTLTVMGDRSGFVWTNPPVNNRIDELVAAKWKRMKILPSELCTDAEFIRRVSLDLVGLPPTPEQVRQFLADDRPTRVKRDELIERLIGSDAYVDHWANKWADLLQVNRKFLGPEGAQAFHQWIWNEVKANTPYDEFCRKLLEASGSNKGNPAASYYKILREPAAIMENTTQLFLATRFNCNKCHDHPFERWTQDQYYQTAAWFARIGLKPDPASKNKRIGGTAVEGSKPLYEIVYDKPKGEVVHERTGAQTPPAFPFACQHDEPEKATRRQRLASWLTSPDNPYFARSYVNRLWAYLTGRGLIDPIDDIRAGNPPTNPALLDWLTDRFIKHGFDTRDLIRLICQSRTYQLSIRTHKWNEDDTINYSHATPRRLPAEVLFDAIYAAAGAKSKFPGLPEGTRAQQLPDAGVKLPDGFLSNLGRPARESACECERSSDLQLGAVMGLITGPTVDRAISDPKNAIAQLIAADTKDKKVVEDLYLRVLNRPAQPAEVERTLKILHDIKPEHERLLAELEAYKKELVPVLERKEQQRQKDIAEARAEVAAYEKQIAPREAERDRKQQEAIARAEAAIRDYNTALPKKLAAWEQDADRQTVWTVLKPTDLKAPKDTTLTVEDDLAIFASGKSGRGVYTVTAKTDLRGITGLRLELLPDKRLPKNGPGRAEDGNLVLTELAVAAAPASAPDQPKNIALLNARADFSQKGYDIKTAIDGKTPASNNGWAIAPQLGKRHVATFEFKEPLDLEGGARLTITFNQNFNSGQHSLGKFRLALTKSRKPIDFGLPDHIQPLLQIAAGERTPEQTRALEDYFRSRDKDYRKLADQLAQAKKPRPMDPQLKVLQDKLARVQQPLPPDPKLAELERAVKLSTEQLKHQRLTAAQDLAWALINTPAFLFNH